MMKKQYIYCWDDSLDLNDNFRTQREDCIGIIAPLNTIFSFLVIGGILYD